jgi:ankyrin repeat protein
VADMALLKAVRKGSQSAVLSAFGDASIDDRNAALRRAVASSKVEIASFLLAQGVSVNAASPHSGYTPLQHAVWAGAHPAVVDLLLRQGACPKDQNCHGSLSHVADPQRQISITAPFAQHSCLECCPAPQTVAGIWLAPADNIAVTSPAAQPSDCLVLACRTVSPVGAPALLEAVSNGSLSAVVSAFGDATTDDRNTALRRAVAGSQLEIASYLLAQGVSVNAASPHSGYTPLQHAVWAGAHPDVVDVLLRQGACPRQRALTNGQNCYDFLSRVADPQQQISIAGLFAQHSCLECGFASQPLAGIWLPPADNIEQLS